MVGSTFISIGLHISFIIIAYFGMPSLKIKEPIEQPIDIVDDTPISSQTSLKLGTATVKEENDKIEAAIKKHEQRRQSIRGEVELESIARKLQEEKKMKHDKQSIKENLSLGDLTKRIGKFKDILTQELSDSEDSEEDNKPPSPPAAIQIVIDDISNNEIDISNNIV